MKKIYNIRLKNEPKAKINAAMGLRKEFNLGLKASLDKVDELLSVGEISVSNGSFYYDLLNYASVNVIDRLMGEIFDCDFDNPVVINVFSNGNIEMPDDETQKALTWFEELSKEEKAMVELVGYWHNRPCVAYC